MSDRTYDYERDEPFERPDDDAPVERASENVFDGWPELKDDEPASSADESEESAPAGYPTEWRPAREPASSRPGPDGRESDEREPDAAELLSSDPASNDPVSNDPESSDPESSDPVFELEPEPVLDQASPVVTGESSSTGETEARDDAAGWEDDPEDDNVIAEPSGVMGISEHAPGELQIPPDVPVLEGEPRGERRAVGIVVSRFNGTVTSKLLEGALAELADRGVDSHSITVMPVPGAFELPIAAMALAKTRRFACIVALGCVIRGDTPHFDYVSSEAASGLQLAAIETGVPVAFGVLTLDRPDQAEARFDKGAEAVRTGLEMADVFANLRAAAAR